jgi:acetylornithine deacetylase
MLTDFMASLAEAKPQLKTTIVVIFIANEENGTFKGIGIDQLAAEGYMDRLLPGPLFWIDSAGEYYYIFFISYYKTNVNDRY